MDHKNAGKKMQEKRQAGIARGDAKRAIPWVLA